MNKLFLKLIKKDYPYKEYLRGSSVESWAEINLTLYEHKKKMILLDIQWDALPLIEWFVENQNSIALEPFCVLGETPRLDEGLAQAMYRIRLDKFLDPPSNKQIFSQWTKEYDGYHQRHSLLSEMGGSKMQDIFLGCNREGGEVSLYSKTADWKYEFDIQSFVIDFRIEIKKFILDWKKKISNTDMLDRVSALLNTLEV